MADKYVDDVAMQENITKTKEYVDQKNTQVNSLPVPSINYLHRVYQYMGSTGGGLNHGYFYECVSDGASTPTYSWSQVNVQPSSGGGGGSYTAGDGINITNDVISTKQSEQGDIDEIIDVYPTAGNLVSIVNAFNRGDIYSTDEKMIGQWTDGKPLYQKYVIPQDSTISVNLSKSNEHPKTLYTKTYTNSLYIVISELVASSDVSKDEGYITINKNSEELLKMYIKTNTSTPYDGEIIFSVNNGDTLTIVGNWDGSHSDIPWKVDAICHEYGITNVDYLFEKAPNVFNYTKTTDTAISIGEATDYSTEEKIVGTWIDGKPLYQRTFHLTNPSTNWTANSLNVVVDKVFLVNVYYTTSKNWAGGCSYYNSSSNMLSILPYKGLNTNNVEIWISGSTTVGAITDLYVTLQYTKTTDTPNT